MNLKAILSDIVYPAEIASERFHYLRGGTITHLVLLEAKYRNITEHKLDAFTYIYKTLTKRDVAFAYASN